MKSIALAAVFASIVSPALSVSVALNNPHFQRDLAPSLTSRDAPITMADVAAIFNEWTTSNYTAFFANVDPDVRWMVVSDAKVKSMALSGVYNRTGFIEDVLLPLDSKFSTPAQFNVTAITLSGYTAAVEMHGVGIQKDGNLFDNRYCWVCTFNDNKAIIKVNAYLDSALVEDTLEQN